MLENLESTPQIRGRKPCSVTAGAVRDLRISSNRITWPDIAKRLKIGQSTARKLWYSLPAADRVKFKPKSSRPLWLRTRLKKDPVLNRNLWGRDREGYKICELKDRVQNKIWACHKTLPISEFHQSCLTPNGVFLRSLCKNCDSFRANFATRVEAILLPKLKDVKKPKGRPVKVTQAQIDFLVDKGMSDRQIAAHCKVSYSTAKRYRLKSTKQRAVDETDWSNPERYKKNKTKC